jgi:hypothetical protein
VQSQIELGCSDCLEVFTKTKSATQQTHPKQHGWLTDGEEEAWLKGADGGDGGTPARS